jgi:hypothetical protein
MRSLRVVVWSDGVALVSIVRRISRKRDDVGHVHVGLRGSKLHGLQG